MNERALKNPVTKTCGGCQHEENEQFLFQEDSIQLIRLLLPCIFFIYFFL